MIDYTHPARTPEPDGDLATVIRMASAHAKDFLGFRGPVTLRLASGDAIQSLNDWSDTVRTVGTACRESSARLEQPTGPVTEALEKWLARATECLTPYRRLLSLVQAAGDPGAAGTPGDRPAWDEDLREAYMDLLGWMHFAHEEADRCRRTLSAHRNGIPPEQATERFVAGRTAHQDVIRRALRLLPDGDLRRDRWLGMYVFLTVRLVEYGGDSPGEVEGSLAVAQELLRPGTVLDDDERGQARAVAAMLATHLHTEGDPARSADVAASALRHQAVWQESGGDPLAAARFGGELFRAIQLGAVVGELGLRDVVEALDEAVRTMDPRSPELPETMAVRALAYSQSVAVDVTADRIVDEVIRQLDAARATLPPNHERLLPILLTLAQLLTARADHSGSLSDIRSGLTLLRRVRAEELPDPLHRLFVDAAFASIHLRFHFHAGSDDADCTGTGDEAAPADQRAGHSARTHQQLRLYLDAARAMAAERADHSVEVLAVVLQVLGESLLLASTYSDGPGAGPHRGAARFDLVAEARLALGDSLARTAQESPFRAGREMLFHIAALVEAQNEPSGNEPAGEATARAHVEALGLLAERQDVAVRPDLQEIVRTVHSYARGTLTRPADGAGPTDRAEVLRALEARCAAQPHAVHAAAVQLRMHLARGYRTGAESLPTGGLFGSLLGRLTSPDGSSPGARAVGRSPTETVRARQLGSEALGLLARRALVQEVAADAVLTAERAGSLSREIAAWCVEDGAYEEAVEVLERGRALALHTEMATVDVRTRLAELGRADLAEEWHAWRRASREPRPGDRPPAERAGPGEPWDSYAEHPVPDQLGVRVRAVLEEHGALDELLGSVPVPAVTAALRDVGADELVYLLPTQSAPKSGGALRVGRDGRVRWTAMPELADTSFLEAYLSALESLLASPGSEAAQQAWQVRLRELCGWAGSAVIGPLSRDLESGGSGPDGIPHLVLVPLDSLAAVPWAAARTAAGVTGRPRVAVDGLVLSTAPSARMFAAAAARPAARADDSALLVLGLTGEEARVSSSRGLHLLYGHRRLLTPDGQREGDTRPQTILDEIHRACREHGIVDISAHLMPDPSDSWRSHLAFGSTTGEPHDGVGPAVDRLSVQTIAAQRFPVPSAGPGLCISLASCINNLARRHHDESFTMAAAFLAGGASFVLGSLWPVRLHATALIDLLFHHRLREGDAPTRALRRAQLWLIDPERRVETSFPPAVRKLATELLGTLRASGHDPADPALWAGLVAVGR